ncbi:MAG: TonB-dependent receptor, partial [Gammaproteobacteria bacterium]|nr:TonB-dependent receptor [Gammaproteobacteria bacterium]
MTQTNYFPAGNVGSKGAFAWTKSGLICLVSMLVFALAAPASMAQETTATIRGTVLAPGGTPAAGIPVTITDTRTGSKRSATTNERGVFASSGLSVGGPYTVKADSDRFADATVSEIFLSLGETYTFTVSLGLNVTEEVITTAARIQSAEVAVGPSTSFSIDDLEAAPAINRDIKDLIRIDPRIYVDEADVENVHCLGASPRFNSLTVDGVKLNDNFGLNRSGYPTQRMPFPYEAIQQVAVELAPFDVEYGGFTACNINAVTKSGENEFFGSLFVDYTDDSMVGDQLEGDPIPSADFDEKRYGFSVGGPIIKDKLFFFAAYQKDETADTYDYCAGDEVCGNPVTGVTRSQLDRIRNIAINDYDYDPGDILLGTPVEDEKYLIKLDWNINDQHRANFTYNFNEGFNTVRSDGDNDEYEFPNHFYNRGATLDAYSAMLFSDWNENFSTEVRASYSTLDNSQKTRNDVGFPEFRIETYADVDGDGSFSRANVYVGGDDSRQSNKLDYETNSVKVAGTYTWGNHTFTGGYERDYFDVTNLFLQHSIGEYRFDEQCGASSPDLCIDKYDDLSPDDIYYGNAAGTNNPQDAAGAFDYSINTVYFQDEYAFADDALRMVFGLRSDWYS